MKALLIIDVQNDYFESGKCELKDSLKTALNIRKIMDNFREKNLPIIHIQHINTREGASFFLPNTTGVEIHKVVEPLKSELVINKSFPNSFRDTSLEENLKELNISELVVCGMMTHMCVDSTLRAAFDKGYKCKVLYDACTTKDLSINDKVIKAQDVHDSFMSGFSYIFADVITCEDYLKYNS